MATINPRHLLEQADRLITSPPAGPPRQVDLRRAVSCAYYSVFHAVLTAAADEFMTKVRRATPQYALVYRSVDHRSLRDLCQEAVKSTIGARYARYVPPGGFGDDIRAFAAAVLDLQEKRHSADYDPSMKLGTSDAILAINTARTALERLEHASWEERMPFLTILLFSPR